MAEPVLLMDRITKQFDGVKVLDDVTFSVEAGEIHAIVGENGAGKSTLVKILSGVYPCHSYKGEITLFGEKCRFSQPKDAEKKGIAIIHQELMVLDELSVAENILLGHLKSRRGVVNWKDIWREAERVLERVGLKTNVKTKVSSLGIGQKQLVEIAKALSRESRILILDEPTAALTDNESSLLFDVISRLQEKGITIIYISHRMEEVFSLSDHITVLRDGKIVGTRRTSKVNYLEIVHMMVGRNITDMYPAANYAGDDELLRVEGFNVYSREGAGKIIIKDASFCLHKGEIIGFAGLLGSGRTELMSAVFGIWPGKSRGIVKLNGKEVVIKTPKDSIRHKIGFITEDRKNTGLIVDFKIGFNIALPISKLVSRMGIMDRGKEREFADSQITSLKIKASGADMAVNNLSGGNQQKVVIGKWLTTRPDILVMDEPTRGVDVGAKSEIYQIMRQLADSGVGIIMISSDLPEVIGMSDTIAVMHEGKICAHIKKGDATEQNIMSYATGIESAHNRGEVNANEQ